MTQDHNLPTALRMLFAVELICGDRSNFFSEFTDSLDPHGNDTRWSTVYRDMLERRRLLEASVLIGNYCLKPRLWQRAYRIVLLILV